MRNWKRFRRLVGICLAGLLLLAGTGCRGLSDRQMSAILQSVMTTGFNTLVSTVIQAAVDPDG